MSYGRDYTLRRYAWPNWAPTDKLHCNANSDIFQTAQLGDMTMAGASKKVVVPGFGPADLITRVRKSKWTPCLPNGKNFQGFSLADGYQITDSPDFLCSDKYRVTLENLSSGRKFSVVGFCYPDLISSFYMTNEVEVDGEPLRHNYIKHYCRYRVTVEKLK